MGLKELYYKLEDAYYDFLDKLDKAGIPVYALIDPIEAHNIPSFPIVVGAFLLILALIGFFVMGGIGPGESTLTLAVVDDAGNPLSNAIVSVAVPGKDTIFLNTTEAGTIAFKVPLKQAVEITVKKDDFESASEAFTASNATESFTVTLSSGAKEMTKTIKLLRAGTSELVNEEISVRFSCSGDSAFNQIKTTSNGRVDLTLPPDCGILYAAPLNGFKTENDSIDLSTAETAEVFLEAPMMDAGAVTVSVLSGEGQALAGIEVSLKVFGSTTAYVSGTTTSAGTVVFNNVVPGKYYATTYDPTGNYAEFDSSAVNDFKEVLPKQSAGLSIRLARKAVGKIRVALHDAQTQEPVANASVTLAKGDKTIATQLSNASGMVEFSVGENVPYDILVDHAEYILFKKSGIQPGEQPVDFRLEKATADNAGALTVTVEDEAGRPVESARVRLKKPDGTALGSELVTGANGQAVFTRVEDGTYYVYAYKPGFGEASSLPAPVSRRQTNTVKVSLPIGSGTIEVRVVNEEGAIMAGASIRAVNAANNETIVEVMADSDGTARIEVRADRTAYFTVSAQGYAPYTTIPVQPVKDVTQTIAVQLEKTVSKTEVDLIGLYSGNELVRNALNPGQRYTARLRLKLPPGSSFEEAGIHLRTGANENNGFESDGLYLTNVRAATSNITRGQSFTPYDGYAMDSTRLTTGNAKWANIVFPNAVGGIYEAEADVLVRDTVPLGSILPIQYRGWAKTGGGFIRFPADTLLGSKVSVAGRYDLYANTKTHTYTAGPGTTCDDAFCYTFGVEDLGNGIQTAVVEDYPARIQNQYKLTFTIASIADRLFNGVELHIENPASAVSFSEYAVTDTAGFEKKGTLDGSELVTPAGSMGKDDDIYGYVKLRTKREGATDILISLVSQGQKLFERKVRVNVLPAAEMDVDVLPKIIVPFINNNLLLKVTEKGTDHTISDATITIRRNEATIVSGKTNSEGVFVYQLTPTGAGSKITILVEKTGYRQVENTILVSENILVVKPSLIKDLLTIGSNPEKEYTIAVGNQTEIPLIIDEVRESSVFREFFRFTFADAYAGTELATNTEATLQLVVGLMPAAARILEPKKVSGSIDITVSNKEFQKTWTVSIPVELRIGFGDEVDDSTCFSVFPQDLDVSTNTNVKTYELTLRNNCAVNGQAIPLTKIEVKLNEANKNPIGEFFLSVDAPEGGGQNRVRLTNQPSKVLDVLQESTEIPLTLEFKPAEISSGESKPQLVFTAVHNTATGQETLKQLVKALVRVNDLAQCLEFIGTDKLVVTSNPFNLGYNQYSANTTYDPSQYAIPDPYRNSYGYSTGLTQPYSGAQTNVPVSSSPYLVNNQGQPIDPVTGQATTQATQPNQPYDPNYNYYNQPYNSQTYNQAYASQPASLRSYPYSDYRAPNYNYDYYGGQAAAGQSRGSSGNFSVKNNCASSVVLDFNPEAGLQVNPQRAVSLEPNGEQTITVQPAYVLGSYSIEARGKLKDSKEPSVQLRLINVIVDNEYSRTYSDCIDINPGGTISLQNFLGKPKKFEVINKCYLEGIRVENTPGAINFSNRDMILAWNIKGEKLETKSDGKITQIVSFDLVPNVQQYQNKAPPFPFEGSPVAKLGNLTYFLTAGYYRVNAPTELTVFFTNRTGQRSSRVFNVTIQDLFAIGEFLERWMSYGDPNATPQSCLNADVFKLSDHLFKGTENNCIPVDLFDKGGGVYTYNTATDSPVPFFKFAKQTAGGEVGGCGRMDRITSVSINKGQLERNGITVNFEIGKSGMEQDLRGSLQNVLTLGGLLGNEAPKGGHDLIMRVDTTAKNGSGGWNGRATKFTDTITVTVERAINGKRGNVILPLNFCVNQGLPVREGLQSKDQYGCENGESGPSVITKYGFDKLLFDWRWDSVGKETCGAYEYHEGKEPKLKDSGYYYCDAAQASIGLAKRAKAIKGLLERAPGKEIKSSDLHRYAIKTLTIPKVDNGKDRVYFLAENGEILGGSLIGTDIDFIRAQADILQRASNYDKFVDVTQADNMLKSVKGMLDAIAFLNEGIQNLQRNAVVEIREDSETLKKQGLLPKEYTAALTEIKAHPPENTGYAISGKRVWLMTLKEYNDFHEAVLSAEAGPKGYLLAAFAPAAPPATNHQKEKTIRFLNVLRDSIRFRVGIRNRPDLMAKEKLKVLEKGMLAPGVTKPEGGFGKFYYDNIQFKAYLKEDAFSDGFRAAFEKAYADKLAVTVEANATGETPMPKFTDWAFDPASFQSGLYDVTLDYAKDATGKESMKVTLKKTQDLNPDYARNTLFNLPLDNMLGVDGTQLSREGYGTAYRVRGGNEDKFFFSYGASDSKQTAKPVQGLNGLKNLDFEYVNDYDTTRTGKLLTLLLGGNGQGNLTFIPSDPVPMQMEIEKTDADAFKMAGVLYELKTKGAKQGTQLLNWEAESNTITGKTGAVYETVESVGRMCKNKGDNRYNGLLFDDEPKKGKAVLKAVTYVPVRTGDVTASELTLACSKDSAKLTILDDGTKRMASGEQSVKLNEAGGLAKLAEKYSFTGLLKLVGEGKVCLEMNSGGTGGATGTTPTVTPASPPSCPATSFPGGWQPIYDNSCTQAGQWRQATPSTFEAKDQAGAPLAVQTDPKGWYVTAGGANVYFATKAAATTPATPAAPAAPKSGTDAAVQAVSGGSGFTLYWNKGELLKTLSTIGTTTSSSQTQTPSQSTQTPQATEVAVTLSDGKIEPNPLTVDAGKVKFTVTNNGKSKHSFTIDGVIDLEVEPGKSRSSDEITVNKGSYDTYCRFHKATMQGKMTVN